MSNNSEGLEFSIADCQAIEKEFTKKAATLTNFFTNRAMKAEAAKQVIARADDHNKIKILYDEGKREPAKKPGRIKRAVITAFATAGLMTTAYFGALTYFGKQEYDAKVQGLTAEKNLVLLHKQKADKNNLLLQERAEELQARSDGLQKEYAQSLEAISQEQQKNAQAINQNTVLQRDYQTLLNGMNQLQKKYSSLEEELSLKKEECTNLEQGSSDLMDRILSLTNEKVQLSTELDRQNKAILQLIEGQITQRTKVHGEYRSKGPFTNFVSNYAEFFFGRTPTEQEKTILNNILRTYVRTDGKTVDEAIKSWACNTIILQYKERLQIFDP